MPSRNAIKIYVENGFYHIYNRGVEKRDIFTDKQDYKVFLSYLKEYLSPPPDPKSKKTIVTLQGYSFKGVPRLPKNYFGKIELLAYCLMPNHFHLLIKQLEKKAMENFMRSLSTRYVTYFNKKHDRVGGLFQDTYKAVMILEDSYLLHLSRYIHQNPSEYTSYLVKAYSSYCDYLKVRKTSWVKPDFILKFFNRATKDFIKGLNTYRNFVEKYPKDSAEILGRQTLEE